jgi:hypothetical protein
MNKRLKNDTCTNGCTCTLLFTSTVGGTMKFTGSEVWCLITTISLFAASPWPWSTPSTPWWWVEKYFKLGIDWCFVSRNVSNVLARLPWHFNKLTSTLHSCTKTYMFWYLDLHSSLDDVKLFFISLLLYNPLIHNNR